MEDLLVIGVGLIGTVLAVAFGGLILEIVLVLIGRAVNRPKTRPAGYKLSRASANSG